MKDYLPLRLKAVYDTVSSDLKGRLIDVGSDHGYLALYTLEQGTDRVVCTDIHKAPAEKTMKCLKDNGFEDRSEVFCTDGLDGVDLLEGDVIVMAGLGGNNMTDIMKRVVDGRDSNIVKSLVWCLQPQKSIDVLREYFSKEGFEITDERVCFDRGIFYPIVKAVYTGVPYELSLSDKYYGKVFQKRFESKEKDVMEYFVRLDSRYKIRARGDGEVSELIKERGL